MEQLLLDQENKNTELEQTIDRLTAQLKEKKEITIEQDYDDDNSSNCSSNDTVDKLDDCNS